MDIKHYHWIDNIKIFACLLVLLGHFFQSMVKSNIISDGFIYQWFNQTIYYFHVPLFFVCSGFLYQKFSAIDNLSSWKNNIVKKTIALGVPYFTFSFATWILKTVFSQSTNSEVGGLFESLFLKPLSPYWFLYCLLIIFVITPTFKNYNSIIIAITISFMMKILSLTIIHTNIYALQTVLSNEIWFVLGMALTFETSKKFKPIYGTILIFIFLTISTITLAFNYSNVFISFTLSSIAVLGFIILFSSFNKTNLILEFTSKYTMPIFLMHTLFAAPTRTVLTKIGITSWPIHVFLGIAISIVGPIITMMIMQKTYWLEFFINPWKIINRIKTKNYSNQ